MRKIQMVDLQNQYQKIKPEIDLAIQEVIDSAKFINGNAVNQFADNLAAYLSVKNVVPCANGTDALQIAMMALNLKQDDEIIIPAFTYVATAEVIALLKLKPVLVDVDESTFLIDVDKIESAITPKTKAIVPVHLFGQCADMESIMHIAQQNNLFVIEDVAQAIGADFTFSDGRNLKAGTIGNIGATSFFPSKNLGCFGDGGAMFTNDNELAKRLKMIANHGQTIQYHHDEVGVNSRLDTIQAAILKVKLKYLNEYAEARNKVANFYDEAFKNLSTILIPQRVKNSTHVFHQYTLQTKNFDRDELKKYLAENKIPSMIYYPIPLHHQKAYSDKRYDSKLPITENLCKSVISLPISTDMDDEQLNYISSHVINFCNSKKIKN